MIDKKIKNRIKELEILYPSEYINVEKHVKELISTYENILGHPINYEKENLDRDFFEHMDIEDLRFLANAIIEKKKEIKK